MGILERAVKSEHDKRGERRALWKKFKRGKFPGYGCIRGKDQHGYAVCEVFPANELLGGGVVFTSQQSFRIISQITMPAFPQVVRLSATLTL